MNPLKQKSQFVKELAPWFVVVFIALLLIGTVKQYLKYRELQAEVQALELTAESTRGQNQDLQQLLSYIQSSAYAEEQARLKFGLAVPGEKLAIIPRVAGESTSATDESGVLDKLTNFWADWWSHFFE